MGTAHEDRARRAGKGAASRPICVTRLYLSPIAEGDRRQAAREEDRRLRDHRARIQAQHPARRAGAAKHRSSTPTTPPISAARPARRRCSSCAATTTTATSCSRSPRTSIRATASPIACSCASSPGSTGSVDVGTIVRTNESADDESERPETAAAAPTIATRLALFAHGLRLEDVPAEVCLRARHLMLDAIGCAMAARGEAFAGRFAGAVATSLAGAAAAARPSSASPRACRCATPRCSTAC